MTPTVEVDSLTSSSWNLNCSENISQTSESSQGRTDMSTLDVFVTSSNGLDKNSNGRFCSQDGIQLQRSIVPDASPAFRETMGKMKSEQTHNISINSGNTSVDNVVPTSTPSSPTSSASSFMNRLRSAFKSSTSSSSQNSSNSSGSPQLKLSCSSRNGSTRRPASFGGVDVVKPWTGRRASQSDKRVSWADELGSNRALISVRLIKPRISMTTKPVRQSTPGHSILRNTGLH